MKHQKLLQRSISKEYMASCITLNIQIMKKKSVKKQRIKVIKGERENN